MVRLVATSRSALLLAMLASWAPCASRGGIVVPERPGNSATVHIALICAVQPSPRRTEPHPRGLSTVVNRERAILLRDAIRSEWGEARLTSGGDCGSLASGASCTLGPATSESVSQWVALRVPQN